MNIYTILLLVAGIAVALGLIWYYREGLTGYFKKNKKKISAAAVATTMIGAGGTAILFEDFVPEAYRPNILNLVTTSEGRSFPATGQGIRRAYNSLNSTNGTISIPSGLFPMSGTWWINNSRITIDGDGIGNTILEWNYVGNGCIHVLNVNNFSISDLTINGNSVNNHALNINDVKDFFIDNILIQNDGGGGGIYIQGLSTKRGVISNIIANCSDSSQQCFGFAQGHRVLISNCYGYNDDADGMVFDINTECENITVNNMVMEGGYGFKVTGVAGAYPKNIMMNNIQILNATTSGGWGGEINCRESTFSNIRVVDSNGHGLILNVGCSNITLDGFNINSSADIGLSVAGENIIITNGIVTDSIGSDLSITADKVAMSNCLFDGTDSYNLINGVNNMSLSNCIFKNAGSHNLAIYGSESLIIDGCQFISAASRNLYLASTASNNISITDSIIRDAGVYGIGLETVQHMFFKISDNMFINNANDGIFIQNADCNFYMITDNIFVGGGAETIDDDANGSNTVVEDNGEW